MKNHLVDRAYARYQRYNSAPGVTLTWLARTILSAANPSRGNAFSLRVAALNLPPDPLPGPSTEPIEVLIVSAPKDFGTLPWALKGAIANAGHPITKIHIIVPNKARKAAEVANAGPQDSLIEYSADEAILSRELRSRISHKFQKRSGWIIQQFLCIAGVYTSRSPRVLVLDADTILTRSRTLFADGKQLLPVTLEHHEAYFHFLRRLAPDWTLNPHSHVPHFMPQQPTIWQKIFTALGTPTFDEFAERVLVLAPETVQSPISIDYELYAQGLLKLDPERVFQAKWSNFAVKGQRGSDEESIQNALMLGSSYYSLSFHSHDRHGES